jgi:hypothetical protein
MKTKIKDLLGGARASLTRCSLSPGQPPACGVIGVISLVDVEAAGGL